MKIGLHISDFTWEGGAARLAPKFAGIARRADEAGVDRISVMDHLWQIAHLGPPEQEMLEAYTALGYLAAVTSRAQLLTLVTAVTYRDPGLLAQAVAPLDVLSGGRAILGIGAGRYVVSCTLCSCRDLAHKVDVLREHCAAVGRDYDEIEKTAIVRFNLGENGENVSQTLEELHAIAELGVTVAHGALARVSEPGTF